MTKGSAAENCEFLTGERLSKRIREVASGGDASCAVAFWSEDGIDRVFDSPAAARSARILCDVSMGATSPIALEKLGAPNRDTLRHVPGLHAKIYLSEKGLVAGSANASIGALGTSTSPARLAEAGTFHGRGSEAWRNASRWFAEVFEDANELDRAALEWARQVYRPDRPVSPRAPRANSLLDAVRVNPDRFAGIGFVFAKRASDPEDIDEAKESAKAKGLPFSHAAIDAWPRGGFFTGWSIDDIENWPTLFFEFWQPRQRLSVFAKSVSIHDPENGSVMAKRGWPLLRRRVGHDLPTLKAIEQADASIAKLVMGDDDGILFIDAHSLAARLNELADAGS